MFLYFFIQFSFFFLLLLSIFLLRAFPPYHPLLPMPCLSRYLSTVAPLVVAEPTLYVYYLGISILGTGAILCHGSGKPMLSDSYRRITMERKCFLRKGDTRYSSSILFLTKQGFEGVKGKCVACMLHLEVFPFLPPLSPQSSKRS